MKGKWFLALMCFLFGVFSYASCYYSLVSGAGIIVTGKLPKASGNGGIHVDSARGDASYAQMYRTGSGVAQSIPTGTAWTKLTPFTANSNAFDSTPDHANDRIS